MASLLEKDLSCPICQEFFKDPVVLSCSHSFCRDCLQTWWREKEVKECPVCKRRPLMSDPPRNLALKNLCESFLLERDQKPSAGSGALCSLHSEKLKLFCLDHQQPLCVVCRDSKTHSNHRFRPIEEVAQDLKEELRKSLKPLQEKLKFFGQVKGNCDQTTKHIKAQARRTVSQIKEEFKRLHWFLQEEEEARISALRDEEDQKSQVMKRKIKALSNEMEALSNTIKTAEEVLRAEDVSFLQNYKAAVKRVQQRPKLDDPQLASGTLIDVAKHLGNLSFNIWSKMKGMVSYTPVLLDPNSAHPELHLSEDLTTVRRGQRRTLPENSERIYFYPSVLGSGGFDSGTHSWVVEVGDSPVWAVGVLAESAQRDVIKLTGLLRIVFRDGEYKADSDSDHSTVLPLKKVQRIRVKLDCDKRELSFSDPTTDTHLHTFTYTLTEKMFPYFNALSTHPLRILQEPLSVTAKQ